MNKLKIEKIYEDENIIVLDKPAGILTLPDRFNKSLPSLKTYLESIFTKIYPIHRLDRDTSGVIIFAKNAETHKFINQQFESGEIVKLYHAFVAGVFPEDISEIDIPIMENPAKPGTVIPSVRGKKSITEVKIIEHYRISTLLECKLITGRQHQIRVHLSAIGYPLLVDPVYGNSNCFNVSMVKSKYKLKKDTQEIPLISRLTLHCSKIAFKNFSTIKQTEFTADYPKDLKALKQILRKYSSW